MFWRLHHLHLLLLVSVCSGWQERWVFWRRLHNCGTNEYVLWISLWAYHTQQDSSSQRNSRVDDQWYMLSHFLWSVCPSTGWSWNSRAEEKRCDDRSYCYQPEYSPEGHANGKSIKKSTPLPCEVLPGSHISKKTLTFTHNKHFSYIQQVQAYRTRFMTELWIKLFYLFILFYVRALLRLLSPAFCKIFVVWLNIATFIVSDCIVDFRVLQDTYFHVSQVSKNPTIHVL